MTQESKRPTDHEPVDVKDRQMPLYGRYGDAPGEARITDRAKTTGGTETDPFHGVIEPGSQDYGIAWEFGIHSAVGGFHDAPNPGDILCAALAACLDSTIRIVAGRIDVTLEHLAVEVTADVDVRGTLVVEQDVPVGFQEMQCHVDVRAADGTDPELVERLIDAAEYSCVNLQTLRSGVPVETTVDMDQQ
jgi:uncharacterized OsmC-like protein